MWLHFTKSTQTFEPPLLNNYFGFERYLTGKDQTQRIEEAGKHPNQITKSTIRSPYFSKGRVFWISSVFPVTTILSGACAAIAYVLNTIWLKHYAAFFDVASKQLNRKWDQVTDQWAAKTPLLVPAANYPQMKAWDVYMNRRYKLDSKLDPDLSPFTPRTALMEEAMKEEFQTFAAALEESRRTESYGRTALRYFAGFWYNLGITDSDFRKSFYANPQHAMRKLKQRFRFDNIDKAITELYSRLISRRRFAQSYNQIEFYHPKGDCRGGSEWFIRLFLKTERHFSDATKHMIAVAKEFEAGIPGQGVVLQGLVNPAELLKEKSSEMKAHEISSYELDDDRAACIDKIASLPKGIYRVSVLNHSMVFCKAASGEALMWDPEFGLYERDVEGLLDHILDHYHEKENPSCHIGFIQYQSQES